jgi:hypothetical protein
MPAHTPSAPGVSHASCAHRQRQRDERAETRPDTDVTWAALNALVLPLGTIILRGHIERHLPERFSSPASLERWQESVNTLLREGLFRPHDWRSNLPAPNPFPVRRRRLSAEL